jgi:hypothetical protein
MGMAEKVPGWLERVLLPQISELKGEPRAMNAKMDAEFRVVHSELWSLDQKLSQRIDGTNRRLGDSDKKFDMVQRVAVLEAKVQELQSKR